MKPIEKPYLGTEGKDYFNNIRVGIVVKSNLEPSMQSSYSGVPAFGTVDIRWIDTKKTVSQKVPITFPAAGDGWGIMAYPDVNDIVVVGFRPDGHPIILGFIQSNPLKNIGKMKGKIEGAQTEAKEQELNENGDPIPATTDSEEWTPMRLLKPGELFFRSKFLGEAYFDRQGAIKFTVRIPRETRIVVRDNKNYIVRKPELPDKILEISIGNLYTDSTFKTKSKSKKNKDLHLQIKHITGSSIELDASANLNVDLLGPTDDDGNITENFTGTHKSTNTKKNNSIEINKDGSVTIKDSLGTIINFDPTNKKLTIKDSLNNSMVLDTSGINMVDKNTNLLQMTQNLLTLKSISTLTLQGTQINLVGPISQSGGPKGSEYLGNSEIKGAKVFISAATSTDLMSPLNNVKGNTIFQGTTTLNGANTVVGVFNVQGLANFTGTISMTGTPAIIPLIGVTTIAKVPIMVNGVIAGFIPVIP